MLTPYYEHGVTAALTELRLQKTANAFVRNYRRIIPQIAQRFPTVSPLFKGLPKQILNESLIGAGLGGVLGGGLSALTAAPGERGSAAAEGALQGAGQGLLWGAISPVVRVPIQNYTKRRIAQVARAQDYSKRTARNLAKKEYDEKNWFTNVKELATGKGTLGRTGAGLAALGGTSGLVLGDYLAPTLVSDTLGLNPTEPEKPHITPRVTTASTRKKSKFPKKHEPLIPPQMIGSYIGGMGTNIGIRTLKHTHRLPLQKKLSPFALEILPIFLTSAGAATGFITAKKIKQYRDHPSTKKKK